MTLVPSSSRSGAGIAESLLTAKGDMIAASAADTADNLAVGADNSLMVADAAAALGVKWAALSTLVTWTAYVPTLGASVTPPTLGTASSVSGRYAVIGKVGIIGLRFNFGTSGENAGSGTYRPSIPWTVGASAFSYVSGCAMAYDASANDTFPGMVAAVAGQTYLEVYLSSSVNSGVFSNTTPMTWAANDQLHIFAVVEIA